MLFLGRSKKVSNLQRSDTENVDSGSPKEIIVQGWMGNHTFGPIESPALLWPVDLNTKTHYMNKVYRVIPYYQNEMICDPASQCETLDSSFYLDGLEMSNCIEFKD